ncbi:MAG: ABC transporter permease [Candidatus Izemoplasmatales bacterium]
MKTIIYAKRNLKELLSDPISLGFIIGLPAFLLVFMVVLNKNLMFNEAFEINNFLPSTIVFSYTFLTMFSGLLIAKDRISSFLSRMLVSPLKPKEYILGYMLPLLVIAFVQSIILFVIGFFIGLTFSIHLILAILFLMIISFLFISLGLLLGSLLSDQQVPPVVSIIIQVVAFMSGMWFSLDMIGGVYEDIAYVLPFAHGVDMIKSVMSGNYAEIWVNLIVIIGYIIAVTFLAIYAFKKKMKQ